MNYKISTINWLNRIVDDFDNETLTIKLMKGTVPTSTEVYEMTPTSRDTSDLLATFGTTLDGTGISKSEVAFTPTGTGDVTWMKIIYGNYVITTDRIGLINDTSAMIWLSSLSLTASVAQTMYLLYIKITEVSA